MHYQFSTELWEHHGEGAWHFVTLPADCADEIRAITEGAPRRGFGSVRVEVTIGTSTWKTSIFPDKATASYLLPVKKDVRTREGIEAGDVVNVAVALQDLDRGTELLDKALGALTGAYDGFELDALRAERA